MEETKSKLDTALEFMESNQRFKEQFKRIKSTADISLPEPSFAPIAILCLGDMHLGSQDVNYAAVRSAIKFLRDNRHAYCIINGDMLDNFDAMSGKLTRVGVESQLLPPSEQREVCRNFIEEFKDKILAVVVGNHEEFSSLDTFLHASSSNRIPIGLNRIVINFETGGYRLKIVAVHKARFNSSQNPVHASTKELQNHYPGADVIITSHTHTPAVQSRVYPLDDQLRKVILLQTGTFKDLDPLSRKYYNPFEVSRFAVQGLVMIPDRKLCVPFYSLEELETTYSYLMVGRHEIWDTIQRSMAEIRGGPCTTEEPKVIDTPSSANQQMSAQGIDERGIIELME